MEYLLFLYANKKYRGDVVLFARPFILESLRELKLALIYQQLDNKKYLKSMVQRNLEFITRQVTLHQLLK